jgi:CubicO group peptidase (beta-lactamase class C family)
LTDDRGVVVISVPSTRTCDLGVTPRLERTLSRCIERGFTRSAQVAVLREGEPVALGALGRTSLGATASGATAYVWHCAVKPLVAVLVGMLVDDGAVTLGDSMRRFIPELTGPAGDLSVAALLTHTAGLRDTGALEYGADQVDPHRGDRTRAIAAINSVTLEHEVSATGRAAYSVFANWFLLSEMAERVLDVTCEDALLSRIIEPLGMNAALALSQTEVRSLDRAPFEFSWDHALTNMFQADPGERPDYELLDGSEPHFYMPGSSGVGPIASLVKLMDAIRADATSGGGGLLSRSTASSLISRCRSGLSDSVLGNDLSWGLGVIADRRGLCPALSDRTFGHVALESSCIVFADPTSVVSAGIVFDRQLPRQAGMLRHGAVVGALMADLDTSGILRRSR